MRGFGTILFDMVPKVWRRFSGMMWGFGTILFDMVPKGESVRMDKAFGFGTILFDMVPKVKQRFFEIVVLFWNHSV